jgi:ABC-type branched-subunit amino acid transport system ATPase component
MALQRFKIQNQKAVVLAECSSVPDLMVIAGPNGVGKSTLLYAIKQGAGEIQHDGQLLYVPPHRAWRRQQIQFNSLFTTAQKLVVSLTQNRTPDEPDEVLNLVKNVLSQFQSRKLTAMDRIVEARGGVTREELHDIYTPVRELTKFLLPHLEFSRIDTSNQANVRCLFKRTDKASSIEIDLDDLSSGERAIISLFMPFLEEQIERRLVALESKDPIAASLDGPDLIVLIDEPELHLHPVLQGRLLDYLRTLTGAGGVQFILATQSATLLNEADYSELYVLTPPTEDASYNQLVQLATSEDRLTAMRQLSGDTYVLTACRNIVCVEGEIPSVDVKEPTDVRILELLCPELTAAHVLVPFGSKGEAIKAMKRLREMLPSVLPILSVHALVDADQGGKSEAGVISLPVSMIENLLLVPEAIWKVLSPQKEKAGLSNLVEVRTALDRIVGDYRDEEIALRVQRALKAHTVRIQGHTVEHIRECVERELEIVRNLVDESQIESLIASATAEVDKIMTKGRALRLFRGKKILVEFYKRYASKTGMGYEAFTMQVARVISDEEDLKAPIIDALHELLPGLKNGQKVRGKAAA